MTKFLMLGGGDETCKKTRFEASYIIEGKCIQKLVSNYTN